MNEQLSARQTAANNATPLAQQVLEAFDEITEERAKNVWKNIADFIYEWITQDIKIEPEDPFIMVYIDKGKYDPKDAKYKDFFEKHDFKESKGGFYKRMKQSEYEKLIQDHDWITKSFKIRTEVARKQEEEK